MSDPTGPVQKNREGYDEYNIQINSRRSNRKYYRVRNCHEEKKHYSQNCIKERELKLLKNEDKRTIERTKSAIV
jgi:hypothetical protein